MLLSQIFSQQIAQFLSFSTLSDGKKSDKFIQSPTWEGCWLQNSSVHPKDEDQEDSIVCCV